MNDQPIFLGGIDRSGKTLLRLMLATHPNIAMSRRMNLWFHFYRRYGSLEKPENVERCLAAMLSYKHIAPLHLDVERIRRELRQGEPTYARLFALLQRQYAEREGKPRWGDQTGLIERYADAIFAAYPGARMLHMLRDPRDRYAAVRARADERVGRSTAMWLYSAGLAARNRRRYPERYLLLRYEDLVRQPEASLRAVCAFLGEDYRPAMLTMAGDGVPEPKGPLSTAYIGRYSGTISPGDLAFMQLHAGRMMRSYGYTLDPINLAGIARLRFALADWPINLARLLGWRAREAIYHSYPALGGNRPIDSARSSVVERRAV